MKYRRFIEETTYDDKGNAVNTITFTDEVYEWEEIKDKEIVSMMTIPKEII